jgi:hypothetical protein
MATIEDLEWLCGREPKCWCELVDGVLVKKARGHVASRLAVRRIFML